MVAGNRSVTPTQSRRLISLNLVLFHNSSLARLLTHENTSRKQTFYMELDDFGVIDTKYIHLYA